MQPKETMSNEFKPLIFASVVVMAVILEHVMYRAKATDQQSILKDSKVNHLPSRFPVPILTSPFGSLTAFSILSHLKTAQFIFRIRLSNDN